MTIQQLSKKIESTEHHIEELTILPNGCLKIKITFFHFIQTKRSWWIRLPMTEETFLINLLPNPVVIEHKILHAKTQNDPEFIEYKNQQLYQYREPSKEYLLQVIQSTK